MSGKICIKIQGGIGNQLFTFACGYNFARKNGMDLYLDIGDYKRGYFREYQLNRLNIPVCDEIIVNNKDLTKEVYRIDEKKDYVFQDIYAENVEEHKKIYLSGYWQSEKYFLYPDNIRSMFDLKSEKDRQIVSRFRQFISGKNTIAVHVRRGDFATGGCAVSLQYYYSALEMASKEIIDPVFVFFSDDVEYVKKHFELGDTRLLFHEIIPEVDDLTELFCMSVCRNQICANSSYSWWGAWLNNNENKVCYCPNADYLIGKDYYPETWKLIDAKIEEKEK